jgi:microcystin-dependent protein
MPRSPNGIYTLPVAAFVPGALIKSADDNSNLSDIASALTQSLATTGVSTMTGPLNAAAGTIGAPGYTFGSAAKTGFYLAGSNQIGWTANGSQGATLNADLSTTWAGAASFNGKVAGTMGTVPVGATMDYAGATAPTGWLLAFGQSLSTATYALLFAAIGYTYGGAGASFSAPDCRGRVTAGGDSMGGVAASRLTAAGSGIDAANISAAGGTETVTLTLAQLPTGLTSTVTQAITVASGSSVIQNGAGGSSPGGGTQSTVSLAGSSFGTLASSGNNTITVTSNNTNGTAHLNCQPTIVLNKIIYAGV